jgi:hypothetical protein
MKTKRYLLGSISAGLLACGGASAATNYVWLNSPRSAPPFATWSTAAHSIQDAVDAASAGDLILVTNGLYATGGRAVFRTMTNRVAITKAVTVLSVSGPGATTIEGQASPGTNNGPGAIRCVYLADGAVLSGFGLRHGATHSAGDILRERSGGGVWCESASAVVTNCALMASSAALFGGGAYSGTLNNCTLAGNSTFYYGGGAARATLNNCTLTGNSAGWDGGGTYEATLNNCLLTGNSAQFGGGASYGVLNNCTLTGNSATEETAGSGGGAYGSTLNNCIAYYNDAVLTGSNYDASTLNYCCTMPWPEGGAGNVTNEPAFVDLAGGDFRLQSNSPCINAGNNSHLTNSYSTNCLDLDGNPRIAGGTVDMGAYEFQNPASIVSYAWLQQYSLPTDGSADSADPDGDLMSNYQEWQADTDPTNALSVLRIEFRSLGPPVTVQFASSSNRLYTLLRSTTLSGPAWNAVSGANDMPGTGGALLLTDPAPPPSVFYRVRVRVP